jgi:hypothetical protein
MLNQQSLFTVYKKYILIIIIVILIIAGSISIYINTNQTTNIETYTTDE